MPKVPKSLGNPASAPKKSPAANKGFDPKKKAYVAFHNAKGRCNNPTNKNYPIYGGMGIKFLMTSFAEFVQKVGLPPSKAHQLDRIDPKGHYEVSNLRWAIAKVQANNKQATKGGASLSLEEVITKAKAQSTVPEHRMVITVAWDRARKAVQRGFFTTDDREVFQAATLDYAAQPVGWRMGQHRDFAKPPSYFSLPSLTHPGEFVMMRGGPFATSAVDDEGLLRWLSSCVEENLPDWLIPRILKQLGSDECAGAVWVGQVSTALLKAGGFEGMMLALASRLRYRLTSPMRTVFMPMIKLAARLKEVGHPSTWDEKKAPILDAKVLFIPDFQLDVGSAFESPPDGYGRVVSLLQYRRQRGHKTFIGVQNPNKLPAFAQTEVFGHLDPVDFSKELISPHILIDAPAFNPEFDGLEKGQLDFSDMSASTPLEAQLSHCTGC